MTTGCYDPRGIPVKAIVGGKYFFADAKHSIMKIVALVADEY